MLENEDCKILSYMKNHYDNWLKICGKKNIETREEFDELWKELKDNDLYIFTYVLLTCQYDIVEEAVTTNMHVLLDILHSEQSSRNSSDNKK